jgi:hypothetical protein
VISTLFSGFLFLVLSIPFSFSPVKEGREKRKLWLANTDEFKGNLRKLTRNPNCFTLSLPEH